MAERLSSMADGPSPDLRGPIIPGIAPGSRDLGTVQAAGRLATQLNVPILRAPDAAPAAPLPPPAPETYGPEDPFALSTIARSSPDAFLKAKAEQVLNIPTEQAFRRAKAEYEFYAAVFPVQHPGDQQRINQETSRRALEIVRLKDEALGLGILDDVMKKALAVYADVKSSKRKPDRLGGYTRQQVLDNNTRGEYPEVWPLRLQRYSQTYVGLQQYVWDGIMGEIQRELNSVDPDENNSILDPNAVGEVEFIKVKNRRERQRSKERKYSRRESSWGGTVTELSWPETAKEIPDAILEWAQEVLGEIEEKGGPAIHKDVEKLVDKSEELVDGARVRLYNDEGINIDPETDPYYRGAKNLGKEVITTIGGGMVLYQEGEDIGGSGENAAQYAEMRSYNYINLESAGYTLPGVALALHLLKTHRGGSYWMGHPFDEEAFNREHPDYEGYFEGEKPDSGQAEEYRKILQEEIIEIIQNREIFIPQREFDSRTREGYCFNSEDNIARLLLDPDGQIRQRLVQQYGEESPEVKRHESRVGVFQRAKKRHDGLQGLSSDLTSAERDDQIRRRIERRMNQREGNQLLRIVTREWTEKLEAARAGGNREEYDKALWGWLKSYNEHRVKSGLRPWYPSYWDRVRMEINNPEKVVDRMLSEEELMAMYEPVKIDTTRSAQDINREINERTAKARFAFRYAKSHDLMNNADMLTGGERKKNVDPKTGETLSIGATDPITGRPVTGKVERIVDIIIERTTKAIAREDAELKTLRGIRDQARQVVQEAIQRERAAIAANASQAQITALKAEVARLHKIAIEKADECGEAMLSAHFLPTHALKEMGLVEGKVPVWSFNFMHRYTKKAFARALAAYGVEVGKGAQSVPITHDKNVEMAAILERSRRALKAQHDWAVYEFMVGRYNVYAKDAYGNFLLRDKKVDGKVVKDENGNVVQEYIPVEGYWPNEFGGVRDLQERIRLTNSFGGAPETMEVYNTSYEGSTSGDTAFPELIPKFGDFGFLPFYLRLGVTSARELHGLIKGDGIELYTNRLFNPRDALHHAKSWGQAYVARAHAVGGKTGEGQSSPGMLQEPADATFEIADFLRGMLDQIQKEGIIKEHMPHTYKYVGLMQEWRLADVPYSEFSKRQDLETSRQLMYTEFSKMSKPLADGLFMQVYHRFKTFLGLLDAEKPVIAGRTTRIFRAWEYNNTLLTYELIDQLEASLTRTKPDEGIIIKQGYSPEWANPWTEEMLWLVLETAGYRVLPRRTRRLIAQQGVDEFRKRKVLVDGREVSLLEELNKRGLALVQIGSSRWSDIPKNIRDQVEDIQRTTGLLDFMRHEGWEGDRIDSQGRKIKILGENVPPLVRQRMQREAVEVQPQTQNQGGGGGIFGRWRGRS